MAYIQAYLWENQKSKALNSKLNALKFGNKSNIFGGLFNPIPIKI